MQTRAEYRNGKWVLNGQKIFISGARSADFIIVMAVTDPKKGSRGGITAFLVDKGTKGMSIPSVFNTMGEHAPYAVFFDDVEVSEEQVLGEIGDGFAPMQNRLGVRRMEIACRALGYARRCMDLMIPQANERKTFGAPLADRQQVQWWLADSFQEMEMVRWITWRLAWKMDQGDTNWRRDAAMVKLQGSEMIGRIVDRAIQLFGGMGVSQGPAARIHGARLPRVAHLRRPERSASLVHRARPAAQRHAGGINAGRIRGLPVGTRHAPCLSGPCIRRQPGFDASAPGHRWETNRDPRLRTAFSNLARHTARAAGHPLALFIAITFIVVWALCGPRFDYSDTWQLIVNTSTTIVTFLMVFLIQNTQNRDTDAIQIKLNEIIRSIEGAHNAVVSLEDLDEEELMLLRTKYSALAEKARKQIERGAVDTDAPEFSVEECRPLNSRGA